MQYSISCFLALFLATIVGCGGGGGSTVQGKVTYKGAPVTSGLINFKGSGAQPLGGALKEDGSYEFMLPAGSYQVRIDAPPVMPAGLKEGDPIPKLGPRLAPEKYADYGSSGLTLEVTEESPQQHDFVLE
jgi:hypothetical protein